MYRDTIDGHEFEVEFRPLTNNARGKIEDAVGPGSRRRAGGFGNSEDKSGTAQLYALTGCIKKLTIDGEEVTVGEFGMKETYYDEERDKDAMEILLGEIVSNPKNKILIRRYGDVFREFLPEKAEKEEPVLRSVDPT